MDKMDIFDRQMNIGKNFGSIHRLQIINTLQKCNLKLISKKLQIIDR